jgi:hypothetical protein
MRQRPSFDDDDVLRSWSKPQLGDEVLNHLMSATSGLALKGLDNRPSRSQSDSFQHCSSVLELLGLSAESKGSAESRARFDSLEDEASMVSTAEHPRAEVAALAVAESRARFDSVEEDASMVSTTEHPQADLAALAACSPWRVTDDTKEWGADEAAREDENEGEDGDRDRDEAFDPMAELKVLAQSSYGAFLGEQEMDAYIAVGACYHDREEAELARMRRWAKTQVLAKARAAYMQAMVLID